MLKTPANGFENFNAIAGTSKEPITPAIVVIWNFQKRMDLKCACSRYAVYQIVNEKKPTIIIGIIIERLILPPINFSYSQR